MKSSVKRNLGLQNSGIVFDYRRFRVTCEAGASDDQNKGEYKYCFSHFVCNFLTCNHLKLLSFCSCFIMCLVVLPMLTHMLIFKHT